MFRVILSQGEIMLCKVVGNLRAIVARSAGVIDKKITPTSGLSIDEDGLLAEYAFCKHMNCFPDLVVGPRSGSYDCVLHGYRFDIKSTRVKGGRLLATLKPNDDVDIYALAIIEQDNVISFPGYAYKSDLIDPKNIANLGHGNGYVMDQSKLRKWNKSHWNVEE